MSKKQIFLCSILTLFVIINTKAQTVSVKLSAVAFDYSNAKPFQAEDGLLKRVNDACAIRFSNVDLGKGFEEMSLKYIGLFDFEAHIEVHLGEIDGLLLASLPLVKTTDWESFTTSKIVFPKEVTGVQNLYFVFKGGDRIGIFDSFEFTKQVSSEPIQSLVYPNPVKETLMVVEGNTIEQLSIFNMNGRKVIEQIAPSNRIDVGKLPTGMYILNVLTEKGNSIHKIIKE
jgi:Secretion system C-terminal sorting domain/Carbohydrate binding module (family 6)